MYTGHPQRCDILVNAVLMLLRVSVSVQKYKISVQNILG